MPPNKESKLNDFIFKLGEVQLSGLKRPQVDRMLGRAFLLFMVDPLHYDTVTKTDSKWFSHLLQNHNPVGERTHFYCVLIPSPHMTFHKTCLVRQNSASDSVEVSCHCPANPSEAKRPHGIEIGIG